MATEYFRRYATHTILISLFCVSCATSSSKPGIPPPSGAEIVTEEGLVMVDGVRVKRGIQIFSAPPKAVESKTIFLSLENSSKTTKLLRDALRSRGFNISESERGADEIYVLTSGYKQSNPAEFNFEICTNDLGNILESSSEISSSSSPSGTTSLGVDMAGSATVSSVYGLNSFPTVMSITEVMSKYIGGDICLNERCRKQKEWRASGGRVGKPLQSSAVSIQVKDGRGRLLWIVYGISLGTQPRFNVLVPNILEYSLKPFYDLKPLPESHPEVKDDRETGSSSHESKPSCDIFSSYLS